MRNARRLIFAGCGITGLPALALFILSMSGRWAGGHDVAGSVMLQALGLCMAVSALLLVVGVSRAAVSLLSAPVTRDPLNVATSALGAKSARDGTVADSHCDGTIRAGSS